MPSPRIYYKNNAVHFVSTRTEEGLPFVPTRYMNMIIWNALARAQSLYPMVAICGFVFLFNHFHMVIVIEDPEQASLFIKHVKQEISHCVNRLLGRRQHTIWHRKYDGPPVLDYKKLQVVLAYIYMNPVEAGLVDSIDKYPGVSSWEMLKSGKYRSWHPVFSRDSVPKLSNPHHPEKEEASVCQTLRESSFGSFMFELKPFAWKSCFYDIQNMSETELLHDIQSEVQKKELQAAEERLKNKVTVVGSQNLKIQSMLRAYTPKKHGKRMICLASDKKLRVEYITFFKEIVARANEVYGRWKIGDYSVEYPPGLFPPARPRCANLLPQYAFSMSISP